MHVILTSMMQSGTLLLCPAQDTNHAFVHSIHAVCVPCPESLNSCLGLSGRQSWYRNTCVPVTLILLNNGLGVQEW